MIELKEYIDLQIHSNHNKNILYKDVVEIMKFIPSTFAVIQKIDRIIEEELNLLIDYTTEEVLQELCCINQYYSFSENDIIGLKNMYWELYQNIIKKEMPPDVISENHYKNLNNWLKKTNPFSSILYQQCEAFLEAVVCSEYSTELQKNILCLNKIQLLEPILDIGCGKNGNFVQKLIADNFEAHGIDRFSNNLPFLEKTDWLEYDYGVEKWGTIISNLGFSNHFIHHHLRNDGNGIGYAKKYIAILKSLKLGGHFCYAPDVPFIEKHLDEKKFLVTKNNIKNIPFKTTIIKRLS
ncbi:MAG TPA: hypothetical protein DEQ14_10460 [Treponema sp.]|nr:hypothetical protein [Treponema sp.]